MYNAPPRHNSAHGLGYRHRDLRPVEFFFGSKRWRSSRLAHQGIFVTHRPRAAPAPRAPIVRPTYVPKNRRTTHTNGISEPDQEEGPSTLPCTTRLNPKHAHQQTPTKKDSLTEERKRALRRPRESGERDTAGPNRRISLGLSGGTVIKGVQTGARQA